MFLHLATNMNNIEKAITQFKKETNIDIGRCTRVIYDIVDLSSLQDKKICSDLKNMFRREREFNKLVVLHFSSLNDILSLDSELYEIIKSNAYIIEV